MSMSDYPERISISPTSRQKREDDFFLVDRKAFPRKGTEYVRADRIEDLEASKNEALNQLDSALYSVSVLEKRVKSLIDESADLKAKLAKAVKCLQSLIIEYDKVDLAYDEPKSMTAVYGVALDTLAELTGEPEC